jgi:hypothetical protein
MKKRGWFRVVALSISGALFMNCGGGGVVAAAGVLAALAQGEYHPLPMFTDPPGSRSKNGGGARPQKRTSEAQPPERRLD